MKPPGDHQLSAHSSLYVHDFVGRGAIAAIRMPDMEIPRVGVPDKLAARLSMAEQHDYLRRLSRRSILRGGVAGVAGLAVLGGGTAAQARTPDLLTSKDVPHGSFVLPVNRHIAYGANPRTEMRIAWQVQTPVRRPFVRIGTAPWELGHKIEADFRNLHSEVPGYLAPTDQFYLHAEISGLQPGRTYFYGVGHDGFDPAQQRNWSTISSFTTAPSRRHSSKSFTFTAFGDEGVTYNALAADGAIAGQDPKFHLLLGDIAYADPSGAGLPPGTGTGHDAYDPRVWDQYLAQIEPIASKVPWMFATGNHDMEALYSPDGYGGHHARVDFPDNGPAGCPSVYSFIYGNVGFLSLDANDISYEIPANFGYSGGNQQRWLEDRLRFLRAQPDVDFIIAYFHHCAYSTTNQHASEGGVQEKWVPLFDKYQVDAVLNGHNHIYERTDPLRGGKPTLKAPVGATVDSQRDGTTYFAIGGGGKSVYSFPVPDSYAGNVHDVEVPSYHWVSGGGKVNETIAWSRVRYTGYSFVAVDVEPAPVGKKAKLTVRALTPEGRELDRITITRKVAAPSVRSLEGLSDNAS
jgi:hypothetical protein